MVDGERTLAARMLQRATGYRRFGNRYLDFWVPADFCAFSTAAWLTSDPYQRVVSRASRIQAAIGSRWWLKGHTLNIAWMRIGGRWQSVTQWDLP